MQRRLSKRQIALLHAARRQLDLDDSTWRALLERVAGVRSSTDLDQVSLTLVLVELERAGFVNTSRGKPFGNRPGFATTAQVALIKRLWGDYIAEPGSETGLSTWLRRSFRVDHLRFLGFDQARSAIEGLKQMTARRRAA